MFMVVNVVMLVIVIVMVIHYMAVGRMVVIVMMRIQGQRAGPRRPEQPQEFGVTTDGIGVT